MTEVRQGPTTCVRFREVSVKRELTVVAADAVRAVIDVKIFQI